MSIYVHKRLVVLDAYISFPEMMSLNGKLQTYFFDGGFHQQSKNLFI